MIYELSYKDNSADNWLLYKSCDQLTVREEYSHLRCPSCGKIDEVLALNLPVSSDFNVVSKYDWIGTNDKYIIVTKRLKLFFEQEKVNGLIYKDIPSDQNYYLALPNIVVPTDEVKSGMKKVGVACSKCGRYKDIIEGPLIEGMSFPDSKLTIFVSECDNECVYGRYKPLFATEDVVRLLKRSKFKGFDVMEAL